MTPAINTLEVKITCAVFGIWVIWFAYMVTL